MNAVKYFATAALICVLTDPSTRAAEVPEFTSCLEAGKALDALTDGRRTEIGKAVAVQVYDLCRREAARPGASPRAYYHAGRAGQILGRADANGYLETAVKANDVEALKRAAEMWTVPLDPAAPENRRGFDLYERAAEFGDREAGVELGRRTVLGFGTMKRVDQGMAELHALSESGDAGAAYVLATLYGDVLQPVFDEAKAAEMMAIAADRGHPKARAFHLGNRLAATRDPQARDDIVRRIADLYGKGYLEAALVLGRAYADRSGPSFDRERAVAWYCKAGPLGRLPLDEDFGVEVRCP